MALPIAGNPISFDDFQIEEGFTPGAELNIYVAALKYSVSFTTDGTNPIGMDEFYGKEAQRFDVYEAFGDSLYYYYVPWSSSNPYQATFNFLCATKLTAPPGYKLGEVLTTYPSAVWYAEPGANCGEDGGFGAP
jgi:hypothetical protein